jgi:hypothetical protein
MNAKEIEDALNSSILVKQFDLRTEVSGRTPSFTQDEVQQAKNIVLDTLEKEGIDKYEPALILMDNQNEEGIVIVFVGAGDDRVLENGEPISRTYHIQDGKLIRVIKTTPKK